jgi:hypothetical protein
VWQLYQDRVNELDADILEGWNKALDILLIFVHLLLNFGTQVHCLTLAQTGLFSAVVTAFVLDSLVVPRFFGLTKTD